MAVSRSLGISDFEHQALKGYQSRILCNLRGNYGNLTYKC
jgi:hypothetical protein